MKVITWNNDKPDEVTPAGVNPNTDEAIPEVREVLANSAIYFFSDDTVIEMNESNTVVDYNGQQMIINDVNNTNSLTYENVTDYPDSEWHGYKYYYTSSGGWVLNEDWVDPRTIES